MSVVGHFLEQAGIPTVSISLIRPHTETIRPPRALWVSFELGRPLGAPNDAGLQTRVLRAALGLLERTDGPVILEDFDEDAPRVSNDEENAGMFCPLPMPLAAEVDPNDLAAVLRGEIASLTPWYELSVQRQGRTTVGASGWEIDAAVDFLLDLVQGRALTPAPDLDLGQSLRLSAEDIKAWYQEASLAQPGAVAESRVIADWFWGDTAAGRLLLSAHTVSASHEDKGVRREARLTLIPKAQSFRLDQPGT